MQHYDRRGQYDMALAKIEEAMQHTPTVIDLYSVKVCLCYPVVSLFIMDKYISGIIYLFICSLIYNITW